MKHLKAVTAWMLKHRAPLVVILTMAFLLGFAGKANASYTVVVATVAPASYDVVPASFTWTATDAVNGNSFVHTGRQLLLIWNSDTNPHVVTVTSVPDASGRTGDSTKNINGGAYYVFQLFPAAGWRQTDGTIHVTSADPTLKMAVITLP